MLRRYWQISLTLVLALILISGLDVYSKGSTAWAAPTQELELRPETADEPTETVESTSDLKDKNLFITEPPVYSETHTSAQRTNGRSTYFPYKQSMSPRIGILLDPSLIRDSGKFPMLFGISYMLPRDHSPQIEFSFDLLTDSRAHFSAMLRRVFYERQSFRPYVRFGLSLDADAEERLATFSDFDNYLARAGVGLEDLISDPMSIRFEIELAVGTKEQMAIFSFGYSWAW